MKIISWYARQENPKKELKKELKKEAKSDEKRKAMIRVKKEEKE
ncbi:hypothetical protein [Bacillus suaedae]|nr:hypothetical protein [Bacillus suaedae]